MIRVLAGCLVLFFSFNLIAYAAESAKTTRYYVFRNKDKAEAFSHQQQTSTQQANLTTQKKPVQHFFVLLKGYTQWSTAFKQAQLLEKQGISGIEVVKGRFERGYSILVAQFTDKKKAGQLFNKLRSRGLKNVRVFSDKASVYQYIVTVHSIDKTRTRTRTKSKPVIMAKKTELKSARQQPSTGISKSIPETDSKAIAGNIEQNSDQEEEIIIVMSDDNDFNSSYEINLDNDEQEISETVWGASFNLEEDLFSRDTQDVDHSEYANASAYLEHSLNSNWDLKISARLDGYHQSGKNRSNYNDTDLDYGDTYLRYRDDSYRITLGAQTIRWGKVDNLGPLDNMATLDLSRGVMLKWGENYRSSPALRVEHFMEQGKLDLVYLADFREAELADKKDVWYPIDFRNGRMLGFKNNPAMAPLIQNARIDDDFSGDGGWGMRFSSTLDSYDIGLTVQQVRLSTPYYKINEGIRQQILTSQVVNPANYKYTFSEQHPRSWVVGGDAAFQWKSVTWRMEAGWFSDLPVTTTTLKYETYDGFKWAGSAEFYPGDADTRVNLQLSGQHIDEKDKILDLDNVVVLSGEIESLFNNSRWKASGKFSIGVNNKEFILSPEIAYLGAEPFELYTAYHYLDGAEQTIGGFYKYNNVLTFGIRGKY